LNTLIKLVIFSIESRGRSSAGQGLSKLSGGIVQIFGADRHWSTIVALFLGFAALMGGLNSVLQLGKFSAALTAQFSSSEWTQISLWLVLLVVWTLVLGLVVGFFLARQWYEGGAEEGSMASSD
jgi:hypothetical protein